MRVLLFFFRLWENHELDYYYKGLCVGVFVLLYCHAFKMVLDQKTPSTWSVDAVKAHKTHLRYCEMCIDIFLIEHLKHLKFCNNRKWLLRKQLSFLLIFPKDTFLCWVTAKVCIWFFHFHLVWTGTGGTELVKTKHSQCLFCIYSSYLWLPMSCAALMQVCRLGRSWDWILPLTLAEAQLRQELSD